ncbi:unnamed protein product [Trichogramma brassicae]|uniref:Uncharacterized protein n=1 Tax=Trichogramma brassicae TaxID=86971 RepID=A0A6H5I8L1_9HYME|nr:unnamed protein product [Trichogramma brassicae]
MDVVLDRGADLSSFDFPTVNDFDECFAVDENEKHRLKVKYASGPLAIVECLEKRGFLMGRSDAVTIMKLIIKYELYEKSSNLKNVLGKDKFFTNQARKIRIVDSGTSPSLYDLIRLRPEEVAAKQLTCLDYFKFAGSKKFSKIPEGHREACALHLCEIISRRFFRRWTLDPLLELTRYRLSILCCDIIMEKLTYRDLLYRKPKS